MHCKVLSQVPFFIRSYKACWFLENDVGNNTLFFFFFCIMKCFFSCIISFFFFYLCIYFNWRLITLQYCSGFCHTLTWISHACTCVPHPEPPSQLPPHPIPQGHPSAPALSTFPWIEPGLTICSTYDNAHVSMLFSQIIPPSPSPTGSKSLFFTSVSLLLSHTQGHRYHFSKFHIYMR